MKACSLFIVLVIAHLLMVAGRAVPWSFWTPPAFLWQDALIALVFGIGDRFIRKPRLWWAVYALIVLYAAINVPIARILSSPLTLPMIRAAGGPLRDSIVYALTAGNIAAISVVLFSGICIPVVARRVGFKPYRWIPVTGLALVAVGPFALRQVETSGLHRNAYGALWPVRLTMDESEASTWRRSPFPSTVVNDGLAAYRGKAAGRNVIMISLESTASRYLEIYGAAQDPAPNLTKLASTAVVFDRAYAVYPESIKGLFSVLCSRYPAFQTAADAYEHVECSALPEELRHAGYKTALFHSGRFAYLGMESVIQHRGYDVLEDAGAIGGNVNSSFGVDEPSTVDHMLDWIDSVPEGQPFFLTYLPVAGHHPYAVPASGSFSNTNEFGNYLNALHYGDESLGVLLNQLRARHLDEKTIFILFGDHGEAFQQHDGNGGHSMFIYDENVRVPYVIAAPGLFRKQIRAHSTASLIDTAPTVLDLLGLPVPEDFQGNSLLDANARMALFFTDYSLSLIGLYDSCWKYIYEIDSSHSHLFNACRDPQELVNLSSQETSRAETYRLHLKRWIAAQKLP
jgi:hypothetical protein